MLLSVLRVIISVVVSRGSQNEQTIELAKQFLAENRSLAVSVFKRQARIGAGGEGTKVVDVDELAELFTLLMTMTDFIDVIPRPSSPA